MKVIKSAKKSPKSRAEPIAKNKSLDKDGLAQEVAISKVSSKRKGSKRERLRMNLHASKLIEK
jgi:hypothetical protein